MASLPTDAAEDSQGPHGAPDAVWLSTQEAARRLGVTARTLYRFIDQGDLPAYRLGRVIRLTLQDVDAFIEASRIEPGSLEHLYPDTSVKS
jgi:excisionase family DNA binding protein